MAKSFLNQENLTRGLRNNNPGNLRRLSPKNGQPQYWNGEVPYHHSKDASFSQFYRLIDGIRAMMKDVVNDINKGQNTITKLITAYAPPTENNTALYINSVVNALGIGADALLDLSEATVLAIAKIIVLKENGPANASKITDKDYNDALAILGMDLKKKAQEPTTQA